MADNTSATERLALSIAFDALTLIASPKRPDGTYNRGREACEALARETLTKINDLLSPQDGGAAPAAVPDGSAPALDASKPIQIYTDGGCSGNPGPAGWGFVMLQEGRVVHEAAGFIGVATNQVAELVAAIEGLRAAPEGVALELVSDSQYTLKGLMEWRKGWERKGWKNAAGEPVANQKYWRELYALADLRKVRTRWVKGHSGDIYNERCDELARAAIRTRG